MHNDWTRVTAKIAGVVTFGVIVIGIITGSIIYAVGYYSKNIPAPVEQSRLYTDLENLLKKRSDKFRGDVGILVKDISSGESIKINSDKLFPSASLVKMPIMAAVFQAQEEGKISMDSQLTLQRRHKVFSHKGFYLKRVGKKFKVRDIVEQMIIESDNTAANMLVEALGFGYLNQKFVEFGLKNTDLKRGIMELKWRKLGIDNYTTPDDMAYLLEKIYHKELVSPKASEEMLQVLKNQKINDRIPYYLPRNLDIAHKTGLLNDTVSDVGIVFTPKGDFVICVITANIRNYKMAKRFIREIADCTYRQCYAL
jgi:beta-lactamase class A